MDMKRLDADLASDEIKGSLEESLKLAETLGLNGTPSYIIGNDVVIGAVGLDALRVKVSTARCGKATC
jgi:protein-disulfide isomerase